MSFSKVVSWVLLSVVCIYSIVVLIGMRTLDLSLDHSMQATNCLFVIFGVNLCIIGYNKGWGR